MIYIVSAVLITAIFLIFVIKKLINKKNKLYKTSKEEIEELKRKTEENRDDYASVYRLAEIEEKIGETESALKRYEQLLKASFFKEKEEELKICMKLEKKYEDEKKYEEGFKYTLKICKLNSNDMYYNIKAGSILGKEGYYILACDYFNKALLNKNEFDTEDIKTAAFCFFNNKNYKKSIVFLEELHNRLNKDKNENPKLYDELNYLNKSLISMYILSDELKIAESFTEKIISEKNIDDSIKLNIDRIYMHILYKLSEKGKFKEVYDSFYAKYNIKNFDKKVPNLILDYCFYSYFLKDTELSIKLFEYINSLNIEEFSIYNFESILKYLSDINKATLHLNKLRNIMKLENVKNDNYEKYVETENIENWERSVDLWESSFINIDYLTSLIEIKKTMDVEKILDELKIEQNNNSKDMSLKIVQKVDKIYNMNIIGF